MGCIGINEKVMAKALLSKLLKMGAITEVLYLKYLLDEKSSSNYTLLKEIEEYFSPHELSAVVAFNTEKESKVFKAVCKVRLFH